MHKFALRFFTSRIERGTAAEDFLDHLHNFSLEEKKLLDTLSARGASLPSSLSSVLTKVWVETLVRLLFVSHVLVPDRPVNSV